ncbi:MAG: hypothetical protein KJN68_07695 [Bacteroidia bacterium]|nr:hypothetical protein [Bacteroidia bacterium]
MNPSASGWINKLLRTLFKNKNYARKTVSGLYHELRTTGFLYGSSLSIVNNYVYSDDFTLEERSKLNLVIALNCAYKNSKEEKPFVKSLIEFYKAINQHKTTLFNDLFGERMTAQTLERIIHRRVQIDPNILTKSFNYFVTNAFLFLDVLAYIQFLKNNAISEDYLKNLEATVEAMTYKVLQSKENKTVYDKNLIDLIEASLRYQNYRRINYDKAIKQVKNAAERKYLYDIACMTSWTDHKLDSKEEIVLHELASDLNLSDRDRQKAIEEINRFYSQNLQNISFLSSKNAVKNFYDNSSRLVSKLLSRNSKRLQRELRESKEVVRLIGKSTIQDLSPEEQKQLQDQLLDIFKTIPSLAIFMLPGGALLLPLVVKIIPKLLPSSFDDNRLED